MKKDSIKKSVCAMLFSLPVMPLLAAGEVGKGSLDFYPNLAAWLIGVAGCLTIFGASLVIYRLLVLLLKLKKVETYNALGVALPSETAEEKKPSFWQRFSERMTDTIPLEKEEEILFDHEYDGIRELDNNLPPWWVYSFYLSIGVAIFYIGFYHFSAYAQTSHQAYAVEMEAAEEAIKKYLSAQANLVDESNVVALTDDAALKKGEAIFKLNCVTCHLASGGGSAQSIGPNLTDEYWLHGGGIKNVFKTIKYGVPAKGMIAWQAQLRPADIHNVASYILTLQGTNPPNAKQPQGELYKPEAEE